MQYQGPKSLSFRQPVHPSTSVINVNNTEFKLSVGYPLIIEEIGNKRFFFTSAKMRREMEPGFAVEITNPAINQVIAFPGKQGKESATLYLGFNTNNANVNGNVRSYPGVDLVVTTYQPASDTIYFAKDATHFTGKGLEKDKLEEMLARRPEIKLQGDMLINNKNYWGLSSSPVLLKRKP